MVVVVVVVVIIIIISSRTTRDERGWPKDSSGFGGVEGLRSFRIV